MSRTEKYFPLRNVMHPGTRSGRSLAGRYTISSPLSVCMVSGVPVSLPLRRITVVTMLRVRNLLMAMSGVFSATVILRATA